MTGGAPPALERLLLEAGVVTREELELVRRAAARRAVDLETALLDELQVRPAEIGAALARGFGVPYEPFRPGRARPHGLLRNLRRDYCEAMRWVPLAEGAGGIVVLTTDPARVRASKMPEKVFAGRTIAYRVTTQREFAQTLDEFFGAVSLDGIEEETTLLGGLDDAEPAPQPAPEIPAPISDLVYFSATAPKTVAPGASFLLGIWAHLQGERAEVLKQAQEELQYRAFAIRTKGPARVPRGAVLAVHLAIPDLGFAEQDAILWAGQIGNCSFAVPVPRDAAPGRRLGSARFAIDGLPLSRLLFEIEVAAQKTGENTDALEVREERPRSAFASYAAENRDEVLARIQGMQKLVPDLDVFLDIASLRSGANWARRLEEEIARRDVFYLFWSSAARGSQWVEAEWRAALRLKGLERIDPVPLEPPDKAPPPRELAALHFNEWTLAYRGKGGGHG